VGGIEVKRGLFPFANACGQTLGYNVYVNRAYLADVRQTNFTANEIHIASQRGLGLIQICDRPCIERISSPFYHPIENLNLRLLEAMALGRCQLCASFFRIGSGDKRFNKLTREDMRRAINEEKGMMFWNREVAQRKRKLGLRVPKDGMTYERRFISPDCVENVWSKFALYEEVDQHT